VATLLKNVATAKEALSRLIPALGPPRTCPCPSLLENAVITNPKVFPARTRRALGLLLAKYYPRGKPARRRTAGG
jgi:hypothetical protein